MDFRMDKSSWGILVFMFATFMFYIVKGAGGDISNASFYFQATGIALLTLVALVALSCIPVVIYCYFVKVIPDIDYSIRFAGVITIVGIITELIF
jgi:hypothetical protein